MKINVSNCLDCGREMISRKARRDPGLRDRYVSTSAHGMCAGCVSAAWRHGTYPNPSPRRSVSRRPHEATETNLEPCKDCGRNMITRRAYERHVELRAKHVAHAAHGMCFGCYNTARHYGTAPREPAARQKNRTTELGQPCRDCGRGMRSRRPPHASRNRPIVVLGGYGMCKTCYIRAWRHNTLPNPAPRRAPKAPAKPKPRPSFAVGERPDDDGPLAHETLTRLRAAVGIAERHAQGEVTV